MLQMRLRSDWGGRRNRQIADLRPDRARIGPSGIGLVNTVGGRRQQGKHGANLQRSAHAVGLDKPQAGSGTRASSAEVHPN